MKLVSIFCFALLATAAFAADPREEFLGHFSGAQRQVMEALLEFRPDLVSQNWSELKCEDLSAEATRCSYAYRLFKCDDGGFSSEALEFRVRQTKGQPLKILAIREVGGCEQPLL